MRKKILFTGLSGFVGQNFKKYFELIEEYEIIPFNRSIDLTAQLKDIDIIIHSAGLAHNPQIKDRESYIKANFELTKILCDLALDHNIKTFIFLSTIKVLGEFNHDNQIFNEKSNYDAQDFYSESKVLAEQYLLKNFKDGLVILRPVLIYGPNMKGNMRSLAKISHLPLPIKSISAKRSIIFVGNLIKIIQSYLDSREGQIIKNCTDQTPLSLGEIVSSINYAKKQRNFIFYFPEKIITFLLKLFNLNGIINRVLKDFIVKYEFTDIETIPMDKAFEITFRERDEKNI